MKWSERADVSTSLNTLVAVPHDFGMSKVTTKEWLWHRPTNASALQTSYFPCLSRADDDTSSSLAPLEPETALVHNLDVYRRTLQLGRSSWPPRLPVLGEPIGIIRFLLSWALLLHSDL